MDMKAGCRPGVPCGSRTGHQRARGGLPGIQPGSDRRGSTGVCASPGGGRPHGAGPRGPAASLPFRVWSKPHWPSPQGGGQACKWQGETEGAPPLHSPLLPVPLQMLIVPHPGHSPTHIPSPSGRHVASGLGEGGDTGTNAPLHKGPGPVGVAVARSALCPR